MRILGISCYYHDAAAALLADGELVAAAEEERFSRVKHDHGFPARAIEFCLAEAGIRGEDLDWVVFYEKPLVKFERILMTALARFPASHAVFREAMISWFNDKLWVKSTILDKLRIPAGKLLFVEHHLAHAASALFCSPFPEAAILTVDGVGEWTTAAVGRGVADWGDGGGSRIELSGELRFPHSLGLLYSAFTAYLGFKVNSGEYKVMGMAPYGEPRYVEEVERLVRRGGDGSFALDLDYFRFHQSTKRSFSRRFVELFGAPRAPESEFFTPATHPDRALREHDAPAARENQRFADVAASIQRVTEELLLGMAREAHARSGSTRLCLAGGVALNSVANGRLLSEGPFEEVFVQPAAGDSGGALGAALYAHHVLLGRPRRFTLDHNYWGAGYPDDAIVRALDAAGLSYRRIENEDELIERAVAALVAGEVLGWFQGRFEWGPRALGHRSILADPRRAEMRDRVNLKIKYREPFRPFAPVVPAERADEYFDLPARDWEPLARSMLLVAPVRPERRAQIPAVTHVDGSGRLQTIAREAAPRYHRLVERFGEETGVPVLLNTSFNLRGEPMVAAPGDAVATFLKSGLDLLVMGDFVAAKE